MIHENSKASAATGQSSREKRRAEILAWLNQNGPSTDRQVKVGLKLEDMNEVRPRITELKKAGKVTELGKIICPVTGQKVRLTEVVAEMKQLDLI